MLMIVLFWNIEMLDIRFLCNFHMWRNTTKWVAFEKNGRQNFFIFSTVYRTWCGLSKLTNYGTQIWQLHSKHAIILAYLLPWSNCFSLVLRVISFKGLLSQWAGVIMYLPSQLSQISIDSDQVSGKLKHDIGSISSC
jgi:hypothetical protein